MKKIVLVLLLGAVSQMAVSQNIDAAKLDKYLETLEANNKFMGSVAVERDGMKIYSKSVGFADVDSELKANEESKYKIGSISKTFTAVLVLQAVEKGKLELNTTLDRYFPTIKNAEKITISQMLYHRSGIHNFTNGTDFVLNTKPKSRQEMVEVIAKGGSDFEPDSAMRYSNSGYVLLSYILEDVYQKPYGEILEVNITKPLGLKNTAFGGRIDIGKNYCNSYKYFDKWRVESDTDPSIPMGAGGIISTARDLNKFAKGLFDGKLISGESLKQMTAFRDNYGMGIFRIPFNGRTGYGHTGGIDGFNSVFSYFPDDKTSYTLISNGSNYIVNNISIAVLSCVNNLDFDMSDFRKVDFSSEDLDKYLGVYSSSQLPIKLTISKSANGKTLTGQGTGQAAFDLEPASENIFKFLAGGIVLEFDPANGTLILKQGGATFLMTRE